MAKQNRLSREQVLKLGGWILRHEPEFPTMTSEEACTRIKNDLAIVMIPSHLNRVLRDMGIVPAWRRRSPMRTRKTVRYRSTQVIAAELLKLHDALRELLGRDVIDVDRLTRIVKRHGIDEAQDAQTEENPCT
jgi:DNA-binding transcriptional ArsR family regulator